MTRTTGSLALLALAPALLAFSLAVAVPPDGATEQWVATHLQSTARLSFLVKENPRTHKPTFMATSWLFNELGDDAKTHLPSFFHRNLHLAEGVFVAGEPSQEVLVALRSSDEKDQIEARKKVMGLNLAKRDLRFADFGSSILPKVDLREAQLQGAVLQNAHLQGANLTNAHLQGAYLTNAQLQGAYLTVTQLQGAVLTVAQLQGADLNDTELNLSDLTGIGSKEFLQAEYDKLKTSLAQVAANSLRRKQIEEQLGAVEKRVGQPASIEKAKIQDAWCDNDLRTKVKGCLPDTDRPAYERKLAEFLVKLSCDDAYTAQGIIQYRIGSSFSPQFDRNLASALLDRSELPDCKGVRELSQDEKDRLKKIVKEYDKQASEPGK